MSAYCVRVIETKELVGVYAAASPTHLDQLIDECCDPSICEYQTLPEGGLFWFDKTTQTSPMSKKKPGEEGDDPTPAGAEFTDEMRDAIWSGEGPWLPIPFESLAVPKGDPVTKCFRDITEKAKAAKTALDYLAYAFLELRTASEEANLPAATATADHWEAKVTKMMTRIADLTPDEDDLTPVEERG